MQNPITKNYINYLKTGENLIFRADIHLIGGCNFKCVMCDNWKREIEMKFEHDDLLKLILSLKKDYNCNYVRFHGQEPTMYNKLEELVLFSKKLGLRTAIKTNGWLLSDKRLITILKYGLDDLYLSIDGPNSEIHDEIRGVKGSFYKNIDIIIKSKKINPDIKIYINSVVMKNNFEVLVEMVDLGKKYSLDRVSFVFLNDKNRKDIDDLNLSKEEFLYFFKEKVLEIYKKAKEYNINVDFSPFIGELVGKNNDEILKKLENNEDYKNEINNFYEGIYGKIFYDKYGCFGPIDHCSINYAGDIYACCVVERNRKSAVGNVIENNILEVKHSEKYDRYRQNSNYKCSYSPKCASNFYTRKSLFKDIYLDDNLYDKNNPQNYYRYLKELFSENEEVLGKIKLEKLRNILLHFYNNLTFYKQLLEKNNIFINDIKNISDFSILEKLPILDKDILRENYEQILKLPNKNTLLKGKTSGNSGKKFEFIYPLDFKRHIKQIAIFSEESNFTYEDNYFSVTPINCNQKIINNIFEPEYVKKIYISVTDFYFEEEYFLNIYNIFLENKSTKFLHGDSKYILYLIIGFEKFGLILPQLNGISLTYSYTNKSLKEFIKKSFNCEVFDNYGCSEVGPITVDINGRKSLFGDNILFEEINNDFIISDLDNYFFPFLRYKNVDYGKFDGKHLEIYGKYNQELNKKSLRDIDNFFYDNFNEILFYQFEDKYLNYYSINEIDENYLKKELFNFLGIIFDVHQISAGEFFEKGDCSKFKFINN